MTQKIKALVVLSGGQDSTTCLALAIKKHGTTAVRAVTFDYGQRHSLEIKAACDVALLAGIEPPEVIGLGDQILKGTSPLTNKDEVLETYTDHDTMEAIIGERIEKTFVPMRNALFLTIAANRAVVMGAHEIWTGVCQADNANYPDCSQSFIKAQEHTIAQALGTPGFDIVTPLMNLSKAQSIKLLVEQGPAMFALLGHSHTAYDGNFPPVGKDHASVLRAHGFEEAHYPDPLVVRANALGLMETPITANYSDNTLVTAIRHTVMANHHWVEEQAKLAFNAMEAR